MDKSYNFFMKVDLSSYIGEWVAIVDHEIVSHGRNAKTVFDSAKKKYPKKRPLLTKVPGKETMIFKSNS